MREFKVGEEITIRADLSISMRNVVRQMVGYAGKVAKITKMYSENNLRIDLDGGAWAWNEHMLEGEVTQIKANYREDVPATPTCALLTIEKPQQNETSIKDYKYDSTKQCFTVTNVVTGETSTDSFILPAKESRIIHSDNVTICLLKDSKTGKSVKGIAKRCPDDADDRNKGVKIAYLRAKIKLLEKELKGLVKS